MAGIFKAIFTDLSSPMKKVKDTIMTTNTATAIKDTLHNYKEENTDKKIDKKVMEKVIEKRAEAIAEKMANQKTGKKAQ